jgi:hypothetical protein
MYLKFILILFVTCFNVGLFSQTSPSPRPKIPTVINNGDRFETEVKITDVYGQPFKNNYSDVKGSPFFIDGWVYSSVKLENGMVYDDLPVRLDVYAQELHFKKNNEELIFPAHYIKEIEFFDSSQNKNYKFQTDFPSIDNQNQNNFYQVLSEGSVSLLKSIRKTISVNKNDVSGEVEKQFDLYEDYYIFSNNQLRRLKKEKEFVLKALAEKKDDIETFLKSNAINFKNLNDIIKLFRFYNSL